VHDAGSSAAPVVPGAGRAVRPGAGRLWVLLVVVVAPVLVAFGVGLWVRSGGDERAVHLHAPLWVAIGTAGLLATVVLGLVVGSWWVYRGSCQVVPTQVEQARQQWSAASRARHAAFLSRLDRELKGPATAIRLSMAALGENAKTRSALIAADQSGRISQLVTGLGDLVEAETTDLDLEPVLLVPLVERIVAEVRRDPTLHDADVSVQVPKASDRLVVRGDPELLSAAVRHLVANAVRFSPERASVTVRCVADDGALVEVVDTGRGIPAAEVDMVWETLARASNAGDVPGSGLGLPLVRVVVERHGGQVSLSSRLGEGTSVRLHLPVDQDWTVPPDRTVGPDSARQAESTAGAAPADDAP